MVEQSIQLAKAIGVNVVAEGIENQEVCDFVKALGCDIGQGYFYAKPEPLSVFDWRAASIQRGNRE
nr:EAL domain-containing protein [Salinivibrio sp. KP-1]